MGAKIRLWREWAGWSVRELARRVGVVEGTVRAWENRTSEPKFRECQRLADELKVDVSHIWDVSIPPVPLRPPDAGVSDDA